MAPLLEVHGLTKRYPGFTLDDVSFSIPAGYVMGLVGPNGAGKTTTIRSILGLVRRDAGDVRVTGLDPAVQGPAARARMGFVHDEPQFPRHLTLISNARLVARFYAGWDEAAFRRLSSAFGLPLRQRYGTLSRGTKMKFALALALSHRARLLVLDEPTSGLDPIFRRELLDVLLGVLQDEGVSVLFSTHLTADLDRVADYVTLLQAGRVVFSALKDEILERWGVVRGGLDLLDHPACRAFHGVHRHPHGFEAITDDADAARRELGDAAVVERPTLEDVVLLTTSPGASDA